MGYNTLLSFPGSKHLKNRTNIVLAPAEVTSVVMTAERACRVSVVPEQLSLAIGKEGQNARLAARLTAYKIDIKND